MSMHPITSNSPTITPDQQQRINTLLNASKSNNTKTAYQSDWHLFTQFCSTHNVSNLPADPNTILLYISELSISHKLSTIKRHLASINKAHVTANYPSPTKIQMVKELLDGISRTNGNKQTPKKALILDDLKAIIDVIDVSTLYGIRDKAMILLGFSTASRRSELVSINYQDITYTKQGIDIQIFIEKNQEYVTKSVLYTHNAYCPIQALNNWLEASNIKNNAVFRAVGHKGEIGERLDSRTLVNAIKKYAELAGLNPKDYAGHSLRSGLATSAAMEGMNTESIMKQTGHNTRTMVDRYVQNGDRYKNNASSILTKIN